MTDGQVSKMTNMNKICLNSKAKFQTAFPFTREQQVSIRV